MCVGCCAGCEICAGGWLCCVLAGLAAAGEEVPEADFDGAAALAGLDVVVDPVAGLA